jgi:ABC transporter ATP binding and permease
VKKLNFKDFIKTNPLNFGISILLIILSSFATILATYLIAITTTAIQKNDFNLWLNMLLLSLVVDVVIVFLGPISTYLLERQFQQYSHQVRLKLISHFYKEKKFELARWENRLTNDISMLRQEKFLLLPELISCICLIVFAALALWYANWLLFLVTILVTIISLFLPKFIQKAMQKSFQKISAANQKYLFQIENWLDGIAEIRHFLAGAKLFKILASSSTSLERANLKQTGNIQILILLNKLMATIFTTVLYLVAGYLFISGKAEFGLIIAVGNYEYYLTNSITRLTTSWGQIKGTDKLSREILSDCHELEEEVKNIPNYAVDIATSPLTFQFENGESLSYPELNIKAGEKVLLTGDTGAGKSTWMKLILGQLKPTTGKISFLKNGQLINYDPQQIRYIPQKPSLLPGTILDNITMYDKELKSTALSVVKKVGLDSDLAKFSLGINEPVDLEKLNVSGGQRQKIILARALVHKAKIIFIDEGTSAIDETGTKKILKYLSQLDVTVVFIAHNFNLELEQYFDRVIHLSKY